MNWTVEFSNTAKKQYKKLPKRVQVTLDVLVEEITRFGPIRGNWEHFGKLKPGLYHCHLKRGNPTYVAVWKVDEHTIRFVEVVYAGTHEKAPY